MADVFISYDHRDVSTAQTLARFLERRGISVWWDRSLAPGKDFTATIAVELAAANSVIVIWSENSIASGWVRDEADEARKNGRLVPVHIGDILPPLGFRHLLSIDLSDWIGEEAGEIQRVVSAVRLLTTEGAVSPESEPLKRELDYHRRENLSDRLRTGGAKRVLMLDGGGSRNIIQLQFLVEIEKQLQEITDNKTYLLSDFFDVAAGVSLGTAISGGIALGMTAPDIEAYAAEACIRLFKRNLKNTLNVIFPTRAKHAARTMVRDLFGQLTMGSQELRIGLIFFTKRLDTNHSWIVCNHPASLLYEAPPGLNQGKGIKDFSLTDLITTAISIPPILQGEFLQVGVGAEGYFVDGFLGPYANPALGTLMALRHPDYGFNWELGSDKLLLISVGSAAGSGLSTPYKPWKSKNILSGLRDVYAVGSGMMHDVSNFSLLMLQLLSDGESAIELHEARSGFHHHKLLDQKISTLYRYDASLHPDWLGRNLNLEYSEKDERELFDFTSIERLDDLRIIGSAAAKKQVKPEHLEKWIR